MTNRKRANFRSDPIRGDFQGVDRETNTIKGAVIIQAGSLNDDRPWHIDEQTLEQVVEFGNQRNKGLKARFTHPNVSDDGMGKMLGKWKNFRVDGDVVRADLAISPRADDSPVGEIGSYVLGLAEDEPEYFGVSIVSELAEEMYDGEESELYDEELGTTAFRLSALYAADVVDEPAATRGGLFDSNGLPDLPAMVTKVLDTHFSSAKPEELLSRFEGFLQKYYGDSSIQFQLKEHAVMSEEFQVNTDDVQLNQEVVETTTEELSSEVVEAPAVEKAVPALDRDFGQKMLERFGSEGLELAFKGLSEVEIVEHFSKAKDERIEALEQKIEALESFQGEQALSSSPTDAPELSEEERLCERFKSEHSNAPELAAFVAVNNRVNKPNKVKK